MNWDAGNLIVTNHNLQILTCYCQSSIKFSEPYGIGEEPEKLHPESVSQSLTTLSQKASYATDNDLSTYSLASASDSDIWFKVEFSEDKNFFLYAVQVFQEFYSDWFYCQDPEDYCRVSQENYQVSLLSWTYGYPFIFKMNYLEAGRFLNFTGILHIILPSKAERDNIEFISNKFSEQQLLGNTE